MYIIIERGREDFRYQLFMIFVIPDVSCWASFIDYHSSPIYIGKGFSYSQVTGKFFMMKIITLIGISSRDEAVNYRPYGSHLFGVVSHINIPPFGH